MLWYALHMWLRSKLKNQDVTLTTTYEIKSVSNQSGTCYYKSPFHQPPWVVMGGVFTLSFLPSGFASSSYASLFSLTREIPSFIRKAPKLMRSPSFLSQSPLSLRLCLSKKGESLPSCKMTNRCSRHDIDRHGQHDRENARFILIEKAKLNPRTIR